MKSVLFSGYYGQRNTGDDAFCVVAAWGAKKYWGVQNIAFLSSTIPAMRTPARAVLPARQLIKGQATLFGLIPSMMMDEIVYFGGSIFHEHPKVGTIKWFQREFSKSFKKNKISAVGVSLGPFPARKDYESAREFLKNMSFLSLRDLKSYEIASEMKLDIQVVRAFDPALLLPLAGESSATNMSSVRNKKIVGISLCRYERFVGMDASVEHAREQAIIEGLKKFIKKHNDVVLRFFIFNDHPIYSDAIVTRDIIDALPGASIEIESYTHDPCQVLNKIAECQIFFAIRLHAAIFSFMSAIPFALVEYHRKCTDFLNEIRHDDALRLERDICDSDKINAVLCKLMTVSQNGKDSSLQDKFREFQLLALRNFQEAPFYKEEKEKNL